MATAGQTHMGRRVVGCGCVKAMQRTHQDSHNQDRDTTPNKQTRECRPCPSAAGISSGLCTRGTPGSLFAQQARRAGDCTLYSQIMLSEHPLPPTHDSRHMAIGTTVGVVAMVAHNGCATLRPGFLCWQRAGNALLTLTRAAIRPQ